MEYWFKKRQPSSWQGWVVLISYLAWISWAFFDADRQSHSVSDALIGFTLPFIAGTVLLVAIWWAKGDSMIK